MWKNIWNSKGKAQNAVDFSIADLMKFDGFDTGNASAFDEKAWLKYAREVAQTCAIANGEKRILEIGCGSGGFLKALNNINNALKINGIDYSESLLKIAKSVMPQGVFVYDEAKNLNTARQFGGGGRVILI